MRTGSYVKWRVLSDGDSLKSFSLTMPRDNGPGPFKIISHELTTNGKGKLINFKNQHGKTVTYNSSWLEGTSPPKRKPPN